MGEELRCSYCGHIANPASVAEACAEFLKRLSRELKNNWVESEMILEAIEMALDGKEPSDFELSYPVVRRVAELYMEEKIQRNNVLTLMKKYQVPL